MSRRCEKRAPPEFVYKAFAFSRAAQKRDLTRKTKCASSGPSLSSSRRSRLQFRFCCLAEANLCRRRRHLPTRADELRRFRRHRNCNAQPARNQYKWRPPESEPSWPAAASFAEQSELGVGVGGAFARVDFTRLFHSAPTFGVTNSGGRRIGERRAELASRDMDTEKEEDSDEAKSCRRRPDYLLPSLLSSQFVRRQTRAKQIKRSVRPAQLAQRPTAHTHTKSLRDSVGGKSATSRANQLAEDSPSDCESPASSAAGASRSVCDLSPASRSTWQRANRSLCRSRKSFANLRRQTAF